MTLRHGVYLARSAWPEDPVAQHLVRARAEQTADNDDVGGLTSDPGDPCPVEVGWTAR
ncbi:MAG: hypothetical protein KIT69_18185 [Propionibacteriaceae bacterium]|nr:hypothetical protein [Propionibacteriaceae bacterium]